MIRRLWLVLFVILCGAAVSPSAQSGARAATPVLMPVPASMTLGSGRVAVSASTTVAVSGAVDERLRAGVQRMMRRLEGRTGYTMSRTFSDAATATLVVSAAGPGTRIPSIDDDESYAIETTASQVRLSAATVVGALRGLETILQLLSGDAQGFYWPEVRLTDRPRFRWRGLLIDVGRHFQPVEVIRRQLDAMAAVKLNVLHFHLSEDQGFRVESRKFPRLHELGSDGEYYTQAQLRDIVEYARMRGIRVVPEFDMPGHVTSWVVAYPELASAPGPYTIERRFGVFDPAFDPTRESTYRFLDTFIGEIAAIFPDAYWHIGGDENNGKQWAANPAIQAFMERRKFKDAHALQTYFNQRLLTLVSKHGKRMMGWDEILQPGLPTETVVHSWRGQASLFEAARKGYDGVLSAGYYIDLLEPASRHYLVDPLPAGHGLTEAEAARILGGEATMWGEWVGPETIESRIWPRTAAIAERLWSPREVNDVEDMYRRLSTISGQLEELGLQHERNRDVLLRRLTLGQDIEPLKVLAGVVEPVKGYRRGGQQRWTTLGPLTHLVDAVSVDNPPGREVRRLINQVLDDAPRFTAGRTELLRIFEAWQSARGPLDQLIAGAPALQEVTPLVADLHALGEVGAAAVEALSFEGTPLPTWRERQLAALDRAGQAKAALEFPMVPLMRELVLAAMSQAEARTMTAAEWRAHVRTLAAPRRPGGSD